MAETFQPSMNCLIMNLLITYSKFNSQQKKMKTATFRPRTKMENILLKVTAWLTNKITFIEVLKSSGKKLWRFKIHDILELHIWRMALGYLRWAYSIILNSPLCDSELDGFEHLFGHCPYTKITSREWNLKVTNGMANQKLFWNLFSS